jgi:butyrate kinase
MSFRVLAVYPRETTTRIGLFADDAGIMSREIRHDRNELLRYGTVAAQWSHRLRSVEESLTTWKQLIGDARVDSVIVPASSSPKLPGGVYSVNAGFLEKVKSAAGSDCVLDLGPALADALARARGAKAFAVVSITSGELDPFSLVTGLPELSFGRAADTLNIQYSLHRFSDETGRRAPEFSVIVADMSDNFLICSFREGRILDISNSNERGPFSLSKSGAVPAASLVAMAYSGVWSIDDLLANINERGGVESYIRNVKLDEMMRRYDDGDEFMGLVARNLAYQTAQEISAQAAAMRGGVDAIILTGICAENAEFVDLVRERITWITDEILIYPGEDDLRSLARFAVSVLCGEEEALICSQCVTQ